jgi:hypothetical protein
MASNRKVFDSKMFMDNLNIFINSHYEFKCNSKYKGFFGRIKAQLDRTEAEEKESRKSGESWIDDPVIYFSDPLSEEEYRRHIEFSLAKTLENSFSVTLMKIIEAKDQNHIDIYKKANIDRKLFSKIRNEKRYIPSKRTAIALAVALELSLSETQDLLKRAGFTLSRSILFDVIIEYFITQGNYDIYQINDALHSHKQPILGG